jgi:hypothetical protein
MKKLHTFSLWERPLAGMFKELLGNEGIACLLRNEQLSAAIGEIPFIECYPELWVVDDEAYPRARMLVENLLQEQSPPGKNWICPTCGEPAEAQFNACWACGYQRE